MKLEKLDKKTILFLSWRDIKAPKKGGAEVFTHEMLKRIDLGRFRIIHISPSFEGASEDETLDGIRYLRHGGAISVISYARKFYRENRAEIDYVVDQCNTHRFFTRFWVEKDKRIFFIHQLTREIWFLNSRFPVNIIGSWTETPFLRLSRRDYTMTVSNSTKRDLLDIGFNRDRVFVLPEGIEFEHWKPDQFKEKEKNPTFIYVGRYVNYKGIDDTVKAFAMIRRENPSARLWLVGKKNDDYIRERLVPIFDSERLTWGEPESNPDVVIWGFVSEGKKLELMSRAHALVFPSRREGWGLIVTEAAAVGTPSIAYNSPGIVDAIDNGRTGFMTEENTPEAIARMMDLVIGDKEKYDKMREKAYGFSQNFHWKHTAKAFEKFMESVISGGKAGK